MNDATIERLIILRLMEWEGYGDGSRFELENVNFEIPSDGHWYRATVQQGTNLMSGMADQPMTRELGALVIQMFWEKNQMTYKLKALADSLGKHFQYYQKDKLTMLTASGINVGETDKGYQYNVRVPFRYN